MLRSEAMRFLGLSQGYSADELKKAYRKLAHKYHPDINHSVDAPALFMRTKECYEFLLKNTGVERVILVTHKSIFSIVRK